MPAKGESVDTSKKEALEQEFVDISWLEREIEMREMVYNLGAYMEKNHPELNERVSNLVKDLNKRRDEYLKGSIFDEK